MPHFHFYNKESNGSIAVSAMTFESMQDATQEAKVASEALGDSYQVVLCYGLQCEKPQPTVNKPS